MFKKVIITFFGKIAVHPLAKLQLGIDCLANIELEGVVLMYDREAENMVMKINNTFKVLLLVGPRQVGKSTLLKKYYLKV